jgi:hypothetical protein
MLPKERTQQRLQNFQTRILLLNKWKEGNKKICLLISIEDIELRFPMVQQSQSWKKNVKQLKNQLKNIVPESTEAESSIKKQQTISLQDMKTYLAITIVLIQIGITIYIILYR